MAKPVLFTPVSVEQLKVSGCFSPFPPKYRLQTWQEVKYLQGKRSGTTVPPSCSGLSWCARGRLFTWTRTGNHPTPKWIISVIITRLNRNLWAALSHNTIKNNRCWKCLEGTEIKDYFAIPSLLQAQLSCVSSCHPQRGSCGGSFSSGLAVLGARRLTESECCLIWECEPSLRSWTLHVHITSSYIELGCTNGCY